MMLSDTSIRRLLTDGDLIIDPPPTDQALQPASVDLRLGTSFMSPYSDHTFEVEEGYYTLVPGEVVLATTAERVEIPDFLVARVEGKSTWGRKFLMVHSTAGFIDPGFHGQITLELCNLSRVSIPLTVGEPVAQISFCWTDQSVARPYGSAGLGSHYQDQAGATPSAVPWM